MDTETYIAAYRVIIPTGFVLAAINWLGYTILAPWSKSLLGRLFWAKLLANMLVLLVPTLQIFVSELPYRRELSIATMVLFILALNFIGYGIYRTQIEPYLKFKRETKGKDKVV